MVSYQKKSIFELVPGFLVLLSCVVTWGSAADIVVFGTSFSDDGSGITPYLRAQLKNSSLVYPEPHYYEGRWTNGWVWTDFMRDYYNNTVHNYAIGGSGVASFPTSQLNDSYISLPKHFGRIPGRKDNLAPVPTLIDQVTAYLRKVNNKVPKDTVCVVEFGASDLVKFLQRAQTLLAKTKTDVPDLLSAIDRGELLDFGRPLLDAIEKSMKMLYSAGARRFLLTTLVPVEQTPRTGQMPALYRTFLTRVVTIIIGRVDTGLAGLRLYFTRDNPGSTVEVFDLAAAYRSIIDNPGDYGLENVKSPCYVANLALYDDGRPGRVCEKPDGYLFWDDMHLTRKGHGIIAQKMLGQIRALTT